MSLRREALVSVYPPEYGVGGVVFFDDFVGSTYDNSTWAITGTGSATIMDELGGRVRVRTTAGSLEFSSGTGLGAFSAAKNFLCEWRGKLIPGGGGGSTECGMFTGSSEWIAWRRIQGTANFQCESAAGGVATTTDSGVAADSLDHKFKIVGETGRLQFFLDDILRATITTNVPTTLLSAYVWCSYATGNSDANMDYVIVTGDD